MKATDMMSVGEMTDPLHGALLIAVAHVPFAREVLLQLRVQAQLYRQMPDRVRATMPSPPSAPWKIPLGHPRFILAFRRWIAVTSPEDSLDMSTCKAVMRASMKREKVAAVSGFVVAVGLLAAGWRPWPS